MKVSSVTKLAKFRIADSDLTLNSPRTSAPTVGVKMIADIRKRSFMEWSLDRTDYKTELMRQELDQDPDPHDPHHNKHHVLPELARLQVAEHAAGRIRRVGQPI